jgi:Ca-activated chloride channel homolog
MKQAAALRAASALVILVSVLGYVYGQSGRARPVAPTSQPSDPREQSDQERSRPTLKGPDNQQGQKPAASNTPDSDDGTIRVDTTLVTIPVSALDRQGKFIPDLKKRDFHIYEDGVEQEIAGFGSVEVPFHVVLVLDTSRSTTFKHEDIQAAATAFTEQLRSQDQVMVVSFDDKVYIDCEFTNDRSRLKRAIYGTKIGGSTKLYDAVDLVLTERLAQVQGRKAIVLFTDGVDTSSKLANARSSAERVEESGVLVFPVQYDTEEDMRGVIRGGNWPPYGRQRRPTPPTFPFPYPGGGGRRWPMWPVTPGPNYQFPIGRASARATEYLEDLAYRSGGHHYHAETLDNVYDCFAQVAEELRHQYALSYYPTNSAHDGSFRRIRVKVDRSDVVVRAREGYRAIGEMAAKDSNSTKGSDRPVLKHAGNQ